MSKKKTTNNATVKNTFSSIQKQANNFNTEVLSATEELVDGSVNTVKQWQNLAAKVLNNGTDLLARQQNFSIDVLENVVNQTKNSGNRAKELVNFDFNFKSIWEKNKDKISIKNIISNFRKNADEVVEDAVNTGKKAITKAKKTTTNVVDKGTKAATKAKKKATKAVSKTTKVATKAKKKATIVVEEVTLNTTKTVGKAQIAVEEKVAK